jgi:hypothetical protein
VISVVCLLACFSASSSFSYNEPARFLTDNAVGATANAVESIARNRHATDASGWFVAFLLCWLIMAVNQLRWAISDRA